MAKLAVAKKVGVPVPATVPTDVDSLIVYYGAPGFTPNYAQANRIVLPIASVPKQVVNGVNYYVFDTAQIPPQTTDTVDVYFTLGDSTDAEEGDFSPVLAVPFDRTPPVKLGTPVIL